MKTRLQDLINRNYKGRFRILELNPLDYFHKEEERFKGFEFNIVKESLVLCITEGRPYWLMPSAWVEKIDD